MLALLLSWTLQGANPTFQEVYRAQGQAPVALGHPAALAKACRAALDQVLLQAPTPPTPVVLAEAGPRFEALMANPCSRVGGYKEAERKVRGDDGKMEPNPAYTFAEPGMDAAVLENVMVKKGELLGDYDALLHAIAAQPHPRVLFMISESRDRSAEHAWWLGEAGGRYSMVEQHLATTLSALGWKVTSPEVARESEGGGVVIPSVAPTPPEAVSYARRTAVDYVVFGSMSFTTEERGSHHALLSSVHCSGAVSVAQVGNGDVVGSGLRTARVFASPMSAEDALNKGSRQVGDDVAQFLATEVLPDWRSHRGGNGELEIAVTATDYAAVTDLVKLLRAVPGVRGAEAEDFADGHTRVKVTLAGANPRTVGKAVSGKPVSGGMVKVKRASAAELELDLGP